jgi:hypothetical protein
VAHYFYSFTDNTSDDVSSLLVRESDLRGSAFVRKLSLPLLVGLCVIGVWLSLPLLVGLCVIGVWLSLPLLVGLCVIGVWLCVVDACLQ